VRRKHWTKIPRSGYRALLSDVLPYELPASIDNLNFSRIIDQLDPTIVNKQLEANWIGDSTSLLLTILLGRPVHVRKPANGARVTVAKCTANPRSQPLNFNIGKSAGGVRQVSLMHPSSQIEVAKFYYRYSDTILYFTNRSNFSIRHPSGVARFSVHRDPVFYEERDRGLLGVEEQGREYESLRSYFTYEKYSHIYKFHESAEFRRLERSYGRLIKVDITRCFDSIYTHTISWVTNGLELSKESTFETKSTFGGRFDKLLQASNDLETHGILIGPEVSRIFAEIILQEVDVRVERELAKMNLRLGGDYEIRRFVDDYFIFCNTQSDADRLVSVLGNELKHFKLYFNDSKRVDEALPLRSERSVAKRQIADAFKIGIAIDELADGAKVLPAPVTSVERLLLVYKGILLTTGLSHIDLANFALVRLELEFERALRRWLSNERTTGAPVATERNWSAVARFIASVLDIALSVYAGGVAASHSVKVSRIAHTALKFMQEAGMPHALRVMVQSKISSELGVHVRRGERELEAPMQALILLDSLASMAVRGTVDEKQLRALLGIPSDGSEGALSAVAILVALRYCGSDPSFAAIRRELEQLAARSIKTARSALDTNSAMLAAGLISSPHASRKLRLQAIAQLGLPPGSLPPRAEAALFFRWEIDDYYLALQAKRSYEVY